MNQKRHAPGRREKPASSILGKDAAPPPDEEAVDAFVTVGVKMDVVPTGAGGGGGRHRVAPRHRSSWTLRRNESHKSATADGT